MNTLLVKLIVVGKMKDRHLAAKCDEFIKRLVAYAKLDIVELKDSTVQDEAARMLKLFDPGKDFVLVMSEEGRLFTSVEFAARLGGAGRRIVIIIGGPYGLDEKIKSSASCLVSLSPMTFTHELARLLVLEQLYRAGAILNNSSYHH